MPKERTRNRPAGGERAVRGGKRRAFRGSRKKSRKGGGGRKAARQPRSTQESTVLAAPAPDASEEAVSTPELSRMMKEAAESEVSQNGVAELETAAASEDHFLTTEELQSLSEVFGNFSEFSEEQYFDPTNLGVPSSGWVSVQTELRTLCSSIEEIRNRSETEVDRLRPLLAEIKAQVEMGHRGREALASSLVTLSEDLQEMRLKLTATSKSAVESAVSVHELSSRLNRKHGRAGIADRPAYPRPTFLVGFAVLVLIWAAVLYFKTGDLRLTLLAVVGANSAGCAALLAGRKLRWL